MGMGQSCAGCAGGDKDNQLVFGLSSRDAPAIEPIVDPLNVLGDDLFDDKVMSLKLPPAVMKRFQECLISGQPTSEEDMKVIAKIMFGWARERGCIDFAHWFFPTRGGGGAVGGMLGAYKQDTLIDLDFGSKFVTKPMKACLPHERLFQGETDGSSFPNGGLRVTHSAAAFTTWDRSSPPFVLNKTLYIPCAFITHFGKCIDEKTPLLRSMDAVKKEGLRLLKAADLGKNAQTIYSYLGWEQEFFVIKAEHYKARPDLVNTGRTLFGKLPTRHQQGDLNYFAPVPGTVQKLLDKVQTAMLQVGCPMAVKHNEVAPGQHEMSPVFRVANVSCDTNVLFMEVMNREAAKMGLQVLFHEKPFAGINGSGKHANWSIGTDTGLNFFYPGKTEELSEGAKLFVTGIACLAHGLAKYNELVRCSVATAGNDHRLGAQEAPPAIISLYPGQGFEQYVESVIAGGDLLGYKAEKKKQETGCSQAMHIEANVEDRNRTAPFPFCGNRFEFRAVGSSQNCNLPVMVCNAIMAAGMAHMAELIEKGSNHRDAVAAMFKENKHVIFTGNGYSDQWKQDAAKRGLPNLNTTPKALATWTEEKNQALFEKMGIYSREETNARQEVMYENYITALKMIEADTMINMVDTGIVPACAKDLKKSNFSSKKTAAARKAAYEAIVQEADKLKAVVSKTEGPLAKDLGLQWAITKGQALPTSSSEHFELEPLSMPALYMLLVVRRGANSERQDRSEVLGMLVDEAEGQEHPKLCLLLSLPSFPEDPLARIDLPIDAAAPGKSGNRRLMDLVPLSGGLFLSVIHGKNESFMTLSTAKPQPGGSEAPANQVVQELSVPGRVLGVAGALGAVAGVLAFFWTATEVFTLTATDVSKTLQEEVIRRASEADAEFDELPLLCWALDVDIDTLLLDAGRRILSGRWDHIGEQGVRTALALWARRSRPLEMPLLQLQECFSELAQHVELMHNLVPSILSLLMPHWPEVVARLDGLHGNHSDEDAPPELANVAWFLSLVVMLLVVLHLRATAPPGEYKRGQEGLALRSWVSEQVPRIVGCRAPRSFQQLAEKVQADFDAWWAQEAEKAQSASPMTSMLASTFTAIEPKKTDFEEYEDLPAGCCSARLLLLGCHASSLGGLARACGSESAGLLVSLLLYGCELCEPPLLLAPSAALAASLLPELLRPGLGTEVIFRILWAIFGPCRPNSTRAAKPTVVNITVPEPLLAEFAELDESETEEARWMRFLCLLGQLAKGRCAECSHVWTFEQEPGQAALSATEPKGQQVPQEVLRALERLLAGPAEEAEALSDATPTGKPPEMLMELLERGACWEVAKEDSLADRVEHCSWWEEAAGDRRLLLLALLAATESWIWELDWSPSFRLHLAYALHTLKEYATCQRGK
ncbi:unnamed protein product [Effrenium voratum]|nr:unnamed protein product [Effrenium voratum]